MGKLYKTKIVEHPCFCEDSDLSNQIQDLTQVSDSRSNCCGPWADRAETWQACYTHGDMATEMVWTHRTPTPGRGRPWRGSGGPCSLSILGKFFIKFIKFIKQELFIPLSSVLGEVKLGLQLGRGNLMRLWPKKYFGPAAPTS